jgi:MOSC domain-containing protein YiiM
MPQKILSVSSSPRHLFSKQVETEITLLQGLGVQGDAHCGHTVKHRSRVARDPLQPNLRQVHLIHNELFEELATQGFEVRPGEMGENITTQGVDLLALPVDTELTLGATAVVRLTGLRNPCYQIDTFQRGLMKAVLDHTPEGKLVRKAGVMAVVLQGGTVRPGDTLQVMLPERPHRALAPV